jgi:hypothetical protein
VILPQSGSSSDSLSDEQAKKLASALRSRADRIRKGKAPRDAKAFVQQMDRAWSPSMEEQEAGELDADFDNPDSMDETAAFFRSSGGVTLTY